MDRETFNLLLIRQASKFGCHVLVKGLCGHFISGFQFQIKHFLSLSVAVTIHLFLFCKCFLSLSSQSQQCKLNQSLTPMVLQSLMNIWRLLLSGLPLSIIKNMSVFMFCLQRTEYIRFCYFSQFIYAYNAVCI